MKMINDLRRHLRGRVLVAVLAAMCFFLPTAVAQHEHGESTSGQPAGQSAEEAQIYTCSMHPQIQLPNPGKCPICGMDLIPVKKTPRRGAGETRSMRELTLSPYAEELAKVWTQPVERKFVQAEVRMVGFIGYDETRQAYITAWVPGRIDRLYVDFTGTVVRKGDPMVYLYSPQLLSAQQELLQSINAVKGLGQSRFTTMQETAQATVAAAKEKLRLWGLMPQQIEEIIRRGKPTDHMIIMAPISGVVTHKNGLEGMYVQTGTQIYTVADLSVVWIELEAYESDLTWIRLGQEVEFEVKAYPGEVFKGEVAFIDPFLKEKTRTVRVRLNAPNPDGRLKPDMFVHAVLRATLAEGGKVVVKPTGNESPPLVIPASAPLITGMRAVVYLAVPDQPGTYIGREIVLGPRAGDYYLVRSGLKEGDVVVTAGNFMIDSSLQIQAKPSMMTPQGGGGAMHEHGDKGASTPKAPAAPSRVLEVPEQFKAGLTPVMGAYEALVEAMDSKDLDRIRNEFTTFRKSLMQVDASGLSGHPQMVWLELDMFLENDALVGSEAVSIKEAKRLFNELSKDFERLKQQFGLDHADHAQEEPAIKMEQAPQAFQSQIGETLKAYLSIQEALADDHFDRAHEATRILAQTAGSIDMKLLEGEAHVKWMELFDELQAALSQLNQAGDLETFRKRFAPVSESLALIVKSFGIYPRQPVYKIRCSMAFAGQGANWLQKDKKVRNPYFGSAMPACGEITETYFEAAPTKQGEHKHE
ncbi:MAG: efflux RND transporter periplasmic adaptor subunit [Desulforhabdus sp.]|nr:efflux RND transporter periplasmic adaptor subunit [Desulforhabdus sp.]